MVKKRSINNPDDPTSEIKHLADVGKLPWTEDMDICLLKLVMQHGAHLPHMAIDKKTSSAKNGAPAYHSKPSDRWRDVTRDFYRDSTGGQPYAERHFKIDKDGKPDYRKIKDHFDTVCKDVFEDIQTGNQSGKEGDLSPKYHLVKSIMDEADAAEAVKEGKKMEMEQLQEKLAKTTDEVLNGTKHNANKNTAIRVKMSDGSIVVDEERAAKKAKLMQSNTLDGKMFSVLERIAAKAEVSEGERKKEAAEVALQQMKQFILFNGHCLDAFLYQTYSMTASGAPPLQAVEDIGGLEMLISLYCSKDDHFSSNNFKAVMEEFDIPAKDARIMHVRLDKWRMEAEQFAKMQKGLEKRKEKSASGHSAVSDLTGTTTDNSQQNSQDDQLPEEFIKALLNEASEGGIKTADSLGILLGAANLI